MSGKVVDSFDSGDLRRLSDKLSGSNKGWDVFIFVPSVDASQFKGEDVIAYDVTLTVPVHEGETTAYSGFKRGALLLGFGKQVPLSKFQVSYRAGGRWGSRVVLAESQEAANKFVADEIANSIGARLVKK